MFECKNEKIKVAIIYVNYNTLDELSASIESCSEDMDFYEISFIIVDNNSKVQKFECIQKITSCEVRVIQLKENIGFAAANNIGIQFAKDKKLDCYLLLNCDTLLTHNYIKKLLYTLKSSDNPGIVTSRIIYNFDKKSICYDGGTINKYKGSADIDNYMRTYLELDTNVIQCTFASGCCMLIPTSVNIKMSEDYFLYYEDSDFSIKMLENGYSIYVNREAILYHTESVSTKKRSNLYTYYFVRNRLMFIKDDIVGIKKVVAYAYSLFWIIKKILMNVFCVKYTAIAILDFLLEKRGKKDSTFR